MLHALAFASMHREQTFLLTCFVFCLAFSANPLLLRANFWSRGVLA